MSNGSATSVDRKSAAALAGVAEVGDEAKALLSPGIAPREYISLLMEKGFHADAVRIIAHALPHREAVWWAWVSARRAAGAEPAPAVKACLEATERWIAQPTDENRRRAGDTAELAKLDHPAGGAGLAAFLTGSLSPADKPPVPPGEFLTAKAVVGAVISAAFKPEPEKAPEKFRVMVAQGLDVVNRIKVWE